ncbi:glucan-binding YG repeat protein, partial [Lachnospiraceae bacterium PF1-22]|uniref:glucosaminidase domain-containing protein n=1 Tax=Ohessyouella blattaphilus TaxID=2949333 RepID=UPI003E18959E
KYYFHTESSKLGVMATGDTIIDGVTYTFGADGVLLKNGWYVENGKHYYYKNDVKVTSWQEIDGETYFFMPDGSMHIGWASFGSRQYYFDENGKMINDSSGYIIGDFEYNFSREGILEKREWYYFSGKIYYYKDGVMLTGWNKLDDDYYFDSVLGYLHTKWSKIDGHTYYFGNDGRMRRSWQEIDGKTYFFMPDGSMHIGWASFNGRKHFFLGDGSMHKGWATFANKKYYFDCETGVMATGTVYINGSKHEFTEDGVFIDMEGYKITGTSTVTITQMVNYFNMNASYPSFYKKSDAPNIESFCRIFYEEAQAEGIKAEVAFTQSMKETGWLKFGGDVIIEQYNFAGIGTTGGGVKGQYFPNVRTGVRAQIQHLKAYANDLPLNQTCVDPRFHLVTRGRAPIVEWLGIQENPWGAGWATGKGYGYDIVARISYLKKMPK